MVDCNGNKPFFTIRNIIEPFNQMTQMFPLKIQITNLSHDSDEVIEWQIGKSKANLSFQALWTNFRRQPKCMGYMWKNSRDAFSGVEQNERSKCRFDAPFPGITEASPNPSTAISPNRAWFKYQLDWFTYPKKWVQEFSSSELTALGSSHFGHEFKNGDVKLLNPLNQIIQTDVSSWLFSSATNNWNFCINPSL